MINILFQSLYNIASSKAICWKVIKKILKGKGLNQKLFEKYKKWIENILSSMETYLVTFEFISSWIPFKTDKALNIGATVTSQICRNMTS